METIQTHEVATEEKTVSILQACDIALVSRRTMYYWIKKGLVRTKKVGVSVRIYLSSLTSKCEELTRKGKRGRKSYLRKV